MMVSGPWAWDNAKKAKINFGVAPIPAVVAGQPSQPFVGVLGCMISAPSKLKDVARETGLSILVYNNPVDYKIEITLDIFETLAQAPNIQAVKESTRDVTNVTRMRNRFGDRFKLLCGVDTLALRYLDYEDEDACAWVGDASFAAHLWSFSTRRRTRIRVRETSFVPPRDRAGQARAYADARNWLLEGGRALTHFP